MLRPASATNLSAITPLKTLDQQRAPHSGAAQPAVSTPGDQTLDLRADIARRVEDDPDYQILKKTFELESGRVLTVEARAEDDAQVAVHAQGGSETVLGSERDLQLSWTQRASFKIDVSASVEDAEPSTQAGRLDSRAFELDLRIDASQSVQVGDPLTLDLGGRGFETTGVDAGVGFDLTGDGRLEQISSVAGDSWLLALDRNGNGVIDDGTELFGDQNGAANGFEELAKYDSSGDGRIDAKDAVYDQLRLLQIRSGGLQVTQSLEERKVASIELGYQTTPKALNVYDQVAQSASFSYSDGRRGEAADLLLGYRGSA